MSHSSNKGTLNVSLNGGVRDRFHFSQRDKCSSKTRKSSSLSGKRQGFPLQKDTLETLSCGKLHPAPAMTSALPRALLSVSVSHTGSCMGKPVSNSWKKCHQYTFQPDTRILPVRRRIERSESRATHGVDWCENGRLEAVSRPVRRESAWPEPVNSTFHVKPVKHVAPRVGSGSG